MILMQGMIQVMLKVMIQNTVEKRTPMRMTVREVTMKRMLHSVRMEKMIMKKKLSRAPLLLTVMDTKMDRRQKLATIVIVTAVHLHLPAEKTISRSIALKSKQRQEIETKAAGQQSKQAVNVNENRYWDGGDYLPKGTACLLFFICEEKNSVGIKDLPMVITQLLHYNQSGQIR
jgi:hypothetical protein